MEIIAWVASASASWTAFELRFKSFPDTAAIKATGATVNKPMEANKGEV